MRSVSSGDVAGPDFQVRLIGPVRLEITGTWAACHRCRAVGLRAAPSKTALEHHAIRQTDTVMLFKLAVPFT